MKILQILLKKEIFGLVRIRNMDVLNLLLNIAYTRFTFWVLVEYQMIRYNRHLCSWQSFYCEWHTKQQRMLKNKSSCKRLSWHFVRGLVSKSLASHEGLDKKEEEADVTV